MPCTSKTAHFSSLISQFPPSGPRRGRKHSPFVIGQDATTRFQACLAAYILRFHHFKLMTAVDRGCPCIDPIAETKRCTGSVRRTLWLYVYDCLPDFPGKTQGLIDLLATHDSNLLTKGIEQRVIARLLDGSVSDSFLASAILDDQRLFDFAGRWFSRDKGSRAIGCDKR